jgi:16S rRNA (adenine1518-N6/adenine1519-N6)-dimethyltransferase
VTESTSQPQTSTQPVVGSGVEGARALPGLLGAADIRRLADEAGVRPTKTRGQNFVIDPNTIRRIVAGAHLGADEHVLEVGPGLGSLSLGLLDAAGSLTAVEIEDSFASQLPLTVEQYRPGTGDRLKVIHSDALKVDSVPGEPTALVANLPYNVAVPVLLHLLERVPSLRHGLVMVQDEVADRLVAGPGSRTYGVPSVKLAWWATARKAGIIGKNVFWPAPQIHSGLVFFEKRAEPWPPQQRKDVFAVVDAAFAQRRKTLRAALSGWAGGAPAAEEILVRAGVDPKARGEGLSVEDFVAIAAARTAS